MKRALLVVLVLAAGFTAVATFGSQQSGDEVAENVFVEPHTGPNGEYASVEDGEFELILDSQVSPGAELTLDDVFNVTNARESDARVYIEHDGSEAVEFYDSRTDDRIDERVRNETLNPGDTVEVGVAVDAEGAETGEVLLENITFQVEELLPPSFDVVAVNTTETAEPGDEIDVSAEIENTGEKNGTQTVRLDVPDDIGTDDDAERTLEPGESDTVELTTAINENADPGETALEVSTDNDSATATVEIVEPDFEILDIEVDEPVGPGAEDVEANITLRNTGNAEGETDVAIDFLSNGTNDDSATIDEFAAGTNETVTLTFDVPEDDESIGETEPLAVTTDDDETTEPIDVDINIDFLVESSDIPASVEAGEELEVDAVIENDGNSAGTQTIEFTFDGETVDSQEISLDPGESQSLSLTHSVAEDANTGATDASIVTDDDNVTDEVEVLDDILNLDGLELDGQLRSGQTGVEASFNVTNDGNTEGTGSIELEFGNGAEVRSTNVSVEAGQTQSVTLEFDVPADADDTEPLTVSSEDDTLDRTLDIDTSPDFRVELSSAEDELEAGDGLSAIVVVENEGAAGTDTVELLVDGEPVAEREVSLGIDDGANRTLEYQAELADLGGQTTRELDVEVRTATDSTETDSVTLLRPAQLEVRNVTLDQTRLLAGEEFTAAVTVENVGATEEARPVILEVDSQDVDETEITLESGSTETVELSASPGAGEPTVTARTRVDISEGQTVLVERPANFKVEFLGGEGVAGENATVSARVENTGDRAATQTVTATAAGETDSAEVELEGGESTTVEFALPVTESELPAVNTAIESDDDIDAGSVSVLEPATADLQLASVTDPVFVNESIEATATVENTGDLDLGDATVRLLVDGESRDTESISVDSNGSTTVELTGPAPDTAGTLAVGVEVVRDEDEETVTRTIDVLEPSEDPFFRVSGLATDDTVPTLDGERIEASAVVKNAGEAAASQNVEFRVDGTVEANETLELDPGETTTVTFEAAADAFEPGVLSVAIASEDDDVTGSVTVREPQPAEFSVTELEAPDSFGPGDASVEATVENAGELAGNETVRLAVELVDGRTDFDFATELQTVDLGPGETTTLELGVPAPLDAARAGVFDGRAVAGVVGETSVGDPLTIDFGDIQSGIDAAEAGQTVQVAPGTYQAAGIRVDEPVTLDGADAVIESDSSSTAVTVTEANAIVRGFAFEGGGTAVETTADDVELSQIDTNTDTGVVVAGGGVSIRHSDLGGSEVETGVRIEAENATLQNNRIRETSEAGVRLVEDADGLEATGNDLTGNEEAFVVRAGEHAVNQNNIVSNDVAVRADEDTFVNATENWWGDPSGPPAGAIRSPVDTSDPLGNSVEDAEFALTVDEFDTEIESGDRIDVDVDARNVGGPAGPAQTQRLTLLVDGRIVDISEAVSLAPGAGESVSLAYQSGPSDDGVVDVAVTTTENDARVDRQTTLLEPAELLVDATATAQTIEAGETASVSVDVENVGGTAAGRSIELLAGGSVVDEATVSLPTGDSEAVTLDYETADSDAGELPLTVRSGDDSDEVTVTVTPPDDTVETPAESPDGGDGGLGGGGIGGGGGSVSDSDDDGEDRKPVVVARSGSPLTDVTPAAPGLTVEFDDVPITEVTLDRASGLDEEVTVSELSRLPEDVEPLEKLLLTQVDIDVPAAAEADPAILEFEIDRDDLEQNDAEPEDIQVARFSGGVWQDLPTQVTGTTEETVLVEAQTPGFSVFAVYVGSGAATPTPTPEETPTPIPPEQPTPTETDTPEDPDELGAFGALGGIVLLVVLVVVVASAALYRLREDPISDLLESLPGDDAWPDWRS